ncbi:MAG: DUF1343 domain-containing protein [Planctomycetota bacterium]
MMPIQLGIDRLLQDFPNKLQGKKFGVLAHQASVTSDLHYSFDVLNAAYPGQLKALFSPQHGIWGEQQANMIETGDSLDQGRNIPVYSLYGDVRWPTEEMLAGLDCLLVDLQDAGTRVYTYLWTLSYCLEVCGKQGVEVLVLDRPNPLGGQITEGPILQKDFRSFVGRYEIPMRHGLTIGEFAAWANSAQDLGVSLDIVTTSGWSREMLWRDTGLHWIPPSPNMPTPTTALLYPGMVLLEGTNLSEGRGTTRPFEVFGAPFIEPELLAAELAKLNLPGVKILPTRFEPTFDKWKNQSCGGVAFYVSDPAALRSYELTVAALLTVKQLWPNEFRWLPPPYEYETKKMPIDILSGSEQLKTSFEASEIKAEDDNLTINSHLSPPQTNFLAEVSEFLLYE